MGAQATLDVNFSISWDYNGQRGSETLFHTAVSGFALSMQDWAPAFNAMIDQVLEPAVEEQFLTYGHGDWAPLLPETVKRKGHDTILYDTGRLFRSFKSGPDYVREVTREKLRWGSIVPYALFHQTGTGVGFQQRFKGVGPGVPMRKIIELSDVQKRKMRSLLVQRLATIARKAGFGVLSGQTDVDPGLARQAGNKLLGI